jgi:hypothetical protein
VEKGGTYGDNPNFTVFVCQINATRCERSTELNIEGAFKDFSRCFNSSREVRAGRPEIPMREFLVRNSSKLGIMTMREPLNIATRCLPSLET